MQLVVSALELVGDPLFFSPGLRPAMLAVKLFR
jgi:hypothetical protein